MFSILNTQSAYSMLKNTIPLPSLVKEAKSGGYDALFLSDEQLYGMMEFFKQCQLHQLKPIIGLNIKVSHMIMDTTFLVYAKNDEGYQNLLALSLLKSSHVLDEETFYRYQKGLICVTAGHTSIIDQLILRQDLDLAKKTILYFKDHLDDFYLGLSLDTFEEEIKVAPKLLALSLDANIPLLPLHQTCYLLKEDKEVYEALIKIDDEKNSVADDADYQFMDKKALETRFIDYPFLFSNLEKVIKGITFTYHKPTFDMPTYPIASGTSKDFLRSLASVGLNKRLKLDKITDQKNYQNRLLYELSVIENMGYEDYFLIVYDFVKYAKTHDILVGPGRGSAAGSLVAYTLGITDVDPIKYDLLFERFLNPERITMPDIDMDFPDNKRDEVLQYVKNKYGKNHVISIITFGTFAVKSSIRDIARVMKIDTSRINGIIKRVIDDDVDETDEEMMRLIRVAKKIEGLPRHSGTHAAGMILSKQDLSSYIPLQEGLQGFYQSQLEASDLEALGLLKMDFLGIRNLAVIDDVMKCVHEQGETIVLSNIPFDDQKTYELLSRAETTGIFQLESMGMRGVLRKLKPTQFEDIVALLALYRPGPMDHIDLYIERRHGAPFTYIHPELEPILAKTYGIIIYQEQIMQIASVFAGYTLAQADLLRRGISKKDKSILESERERFIQKATSLNRTKEDAEAIYDLIVKFADYGFNRSHSVAYAIVAYQMAYLKAHYFAIFMTILLSSVSGNESLTSDYIIELKKHNINVLPPDINRSTEKYQFIKGNVMLPLIAVKSVGKIVLQKIIENRHIEGPFKDFHDFKRRMKKEINDKNIEMLIHASALNQFGLTHKTMIHYKNIDQAGYELYVEDFKVDHLEEYPFEMLSSYEKEALGFNLVYHVTHTYENIIKTYKLKTLNDIHLGQDGILIAHLKRIKEIKTKQGLSMAFIVLDDGVSELEATIFSDAYTKYQAHLKPDIYVFKLKNNIFKERKSIIVERIMHIDTFIKEQKR